MNRTPSELVREVLGDPPETPSRKRKLHDTLTPPHGDNYRRGHEDIVKAIEHARKLAPLEVQYLRIDKNQLIEDLRQLEWEFATAVASPGIIRGVPYHQNAEKIEELKQTLLDRALDWTDKMHKAREQVYGEQSVCPVCTGTHDMLTTLFRPPD